MKFLLIGTVRLFPRAFRTWRRRTRVAHRVRERGEPQFWHTFMARIQALAGVESVGLVENVPLDEGLASSRFKTDTAASDGGPLINYTLAGGDYYHAMGIAVVAGRPFTREDAISSLGHVIISRSAARLLWADTDPIGRRLQREGLTTWETVVGVVDDVIQDDYREGAAPLVYFPPPGRKRSPATSVGWCGRSRPRRRCIGRTRWKGWPSDRCCRCPSRC